MEKKDFSIKYFRDSLPEWKRKMDSIPVRFFYRPMSYVFASVCAKSGIGANAVSYFSAVLGIIGCVMYFINFSLCHIIGAICINIWLILDCTDGNLARCVKKQPFGEFADALSSYLLVGFMCVSIGYAAYCEDGFWMKQGTIWIVLLGAFASISDAMTRAVFHKYFLTYRELVSDGIIPDLGDKRKKNTQRGFLRALFEDQFGLGGFLPLFILVATIFSYLDLIVIYFALYYGAEFFAVLLYTVKNAVKPIKNNDEK